MILKSNAAINSTALAISSGLNFLAIFIWTRLLDPHAFGLYALVSASALLLNAIVFEWLRLVGARSLYSADAPSSIDPARANALFALYLLTAALLTATGLTLLFLNVDFFDVAARWWPMLVLFAMTEMALAIINTISRVRMKAWQFFTSMVSRSVLSVLIGIVLVAGFGMEALGAVLGIVAAQTLVAIAGVIREPMYHGIRPWRARGGDVMATLRFGYPLIFSCALSYGAGVADRFLVGGVLGTQAVGLYAAPVDLLQKTLVFVMMAINLTAYPALVRAYEDKGEEAARTTLDRNLLLQLALGLPAAVGLTTLAPGIANLLLGPDFRETGTRLLPFIGLAALLRCLVTFHLMMVFQVTKRMKMMIVPPAISLLLMVPLSIWAMRHYGLIGMAASATAAQVVTFAITAVLAKRIMPVRLLSPDAGRLFAAAAGMAIVLLPFARHDGNLATLALVASGAMVYGLILLALGFSPVKPVLARLKRLRSR